MNSLLKFFLLLSFGLVSCQNKVPEQNLRWLDLGMNQIDLGTVLKDKVYNFNIPVKNTFDDTITILGISNSCECFSSNTGLPLQVNPKSTENLPFVYKNTSNDTGRQRQIIIIHTNSDSVFQRIELLANLQHNI